MSPWIAAVDAEDWALIRELLAEGIPVDTRSETLVDPRAPDFGALLSLLSSENQIDPNLRQQARDYLCTVASDDWRREVWVRSLRSHLAGVVGMMARSERSPLHRHWPLMLSAAIEAHDDPQLVQLASEIMIPSVVRRLLDLERTLLPMLRILDLANQRRLAGTRDYLITCYQEISQIVLSLCLQETPEGDEAVRVLKTSDDPLLFRLLLSRRQAASSAIEPPAIADRIDLVGPAQERAADLIAAMCDDTSSESLVREVYGLRAMLTLAPRDIAVRETVQRRALSIAATNSDGSPIAGDFAGLQTIGVLSGQPEEHRTARTVALDIIETIGDDSPEVRELVFGLLADKETATWGHALRIAKALRLSPDDVIVAVEKGIWLAVELQPDARDLEFMEDAEAYFLSALGEDDGPAAYGTLADRIKDKWDTDVAE